MLGHFGEARGSGNGSWLITLLDTATEQQNGTLLTGQGGNKTVSWDGREAYLAQLARGRCLHDLWHEAETWGEIHGTSLLKALKSQFLSPLIPVSIWSLYQKFKDDDWQHDSAAIHPAFQRRIAPYLDQIHQEREAERWIYREGNSRQNRWSAPRLWRNGMRWPVCGAGGRLEVRDPTLDPRLLTFSLSVPPEQWARNGQDRLLMRRAMTGILPDRVAWNRKRGHQAADLAWHLVDDREALQETFHRLEASALAREYMDLNKMKTILATLHRGTPESIPPAHIKALFRGMVSGTFLLWFKI